MWKNPRHLFSTVAALLVAGSVVAWTSAGETTYSTADGGNPTTRVISDSTGSWIATYTYGSRTVTLAGPKRTFTEETAAAPVTSSTYVRLLPQPYSGTVDEGWLAAAKTDTSPDLLAVAAQYLQGSPGIRDTSGLLIASDAGYGPLQPDGTRREGADFNDYLGIPWDYPDTTDKPESDEHGYMDCSGFVRMVFGYRGGVPMTLNTAPDRLPRRSYQMLQAAPGTMVYQDKSTQLKTFDRINPGDLVFFDAEDDAAGQIDHVGIYLGQDEAGRHRFISSRKSANGPTMGDTNGRSILDGTGYYAKSFRAVRRI